MVVCRACSALLLALTFGTSLSQVGKLFSRHPDKTVGEAKIPKPLWDYVKRCSLAAAKLDVSMSSAAPWL